MALVLADRVKETTTTTGTGTITLAGAASGFRSFSVVGNGNTTYYTIAGQGASEWEVGIGTYTSSGTTLSRDTVLASSAGAPTKTTFSAGTKDVFITYPSGRSVYVDGVTVDTAGMGATQGDILYASATDTFSRLAKDANATRYLANTGTSNNPAWSQIDLSNGVTGDLAFANLTQGSALSVLGVTGNATADVASIAAGSDNQVLRRSGTALSFGAINLASTNAVTGTLPLGNGGTGQTTAQASMNSFAGAVTSGQYLRGNGTNVVMSAIQAGDVPTLNQNTTGSAATVTGNATGSTFGFNSGYGSVATAYGCRAWVNFNGTGTVAIRASGNVSSITDNGTGDYTVNFTTAMSDANYAVNVSGNVDAAGNYGYSFAVPYSTSPTTSAIRLAVSNPAVRVDAGFVEVSIFR